jgi:hypothetical protein
MPNAERIRLTRTIRNAAITGALLMAVIPPTINHETTLRVWDAAWGTRIGCDYGVEPIDATYPYDAIAVPGAGLYFDEKTQNYQPNSFERRRLHAAALGFVNNLSPKIILLDGQLEPGVDPNINRDYLQTEVSKLSHRKVELPDDAVYIDALSINTATNMEELEKLVQDLELNKILIITDQFHSVRSILLVCAKNVNASYKTVEELTAEYEPMKIEEINKPNIASGMKDRHVKEILEILSLPWDPPGTISTILKQIANASKK